MLRSFLTWFCFPLTSLLLAACCGSTACECNDAYTDAIGLRFSTDTLGTTPAGFKAAEIDTVFLIRVPLDTAQRPKADTVQIGRTQARALSQPVILNNTTPFTQAGNRKLDQYRYQLYLAKTRLAKRHTFDYYIDKVELTTVYRADGCCTCFDNTNKQVYVNGSPTPTDLTDQEKRNQLGLLDVQRR
ncbi:hypothetical protein [Hymenobacter rubripertinctus]|uniref:Lipoprotein n=1 Tax=Hymenobacter rubripertinctus TaxID=2029981 RepID=A0A418QN97_9BACT|nr:hypothetical protein [Hymenobacter rubripertinctus]RIY06695.1 hypothetical protein D0T11_18260 [Hymenobacter rubripertinctus]